MCIDAFPYISLRSQIYLLFLDVFLFPAVYCVFPGVCTTFLTVFWVVFTCEGLPAVRPFSLFDLFPAAIVSLSAAGVLLLLSHSDDLRHRHALTHT